MCNNTRCCSQYHWIDERGKRVKCTAPQYVDYVMSLSHKLIYDEAMFPTKYGQYSLHWLLRIWYSQHFSTDIRVVHEHAIRLITVNLARNMHSYSLWRWFMLIYGKFSIFSVVYNVGWRFFSSCCRASLCSSRLWNETNSWCYLFLGSLHFK